MTIIQRWSSDGKLRKLAVTLTWPWEFSLQQHPGNLFCEGSFSRPHKWQTCRGNLPAKIVNPAIQYWLTKITWDIEQAILRVGEKKLTFEKVWVPWVLLKNPHQKRGGKLFVYLVCLLRSFSKDLSVGIKAALLKVLRLHLKHLEAVVDHNQRSQNVSNSQRKCWLTMSCFLAKSFAFHSPFYLWATSYFIIFFSMQVIINFRS